MSEFISRRLARSVAMAGIAFSVLAPAAAYADDKIEVVVVTAEKRSEDLQKIPVAVTAKTGAQLEQQGIRQPTDLGRIVPSMVVGPSPSTVTGFAIDIRGQVASDLILNFNPSVGFYEDGVNVPHSQGTNGSFFDLSRVEVLRGPQGTLYGRNTTGGAVNLYTRGADFNGYHGFAGAEGGSYDDWKLNGAVNIPLIDDQLAVRVAYQHWSRDGFGKSVITGERLGGDHDDDTARVSVLWAPTGDFTVDARAEYVSLDRHGDLITARGYDPNIDGGANFSGALEAFLESNLDKSAANPCKPYTCAGLTTFLTTPGLAVFQGAGIVAASVGNPTNPLASPPPFAVFTNHDLFNSQSETFNSERVHSWHADVTATWNISDDLEVKSITGYHQVTDKHVVDLDATPFQTGEIGVGVGGLQPVVGFDSNPQPDEEDDRFISEEIDVNGKAFNDRLTWLVGGYYSDDSGNGNQPSIATPALLGITSATCAFNSCLSPPIPGPGCATAVCFTHAANPNYVPEIIFGYDQKSVTDRSWAIFTQEDVKIIDTLTLTLGGRYTEDALGQNISTAAYDASPFGATAPPGLFIDPIAGQFICPLDNPSPISPTSTICDVHQKATFTGYSYLVSLNWQVTDTTFAYVKTSEGYRGGVLQARAAGFPPAKPETAHDYELGVKTSLLDNHFQANMDIYETLYSNKQVTQVLPGPGIIPIPSTPVVNAARATIKGFEGEFTAIPMDGLALNATLTYLDGVYGTFLNAPLPEGGTINASGLPFNEPHWRMSFSGRYDTPLWGGDNLGIQVDWAWHSNIPITPLTADPTFPLLQKEFNQSVGIMNARIDYALPDNGGWESGWLVSLFATNLLNKHYQVVSLDAAAFHTGIPTGITQEPQMLGIQIKKSFGND